MIYMYCITVIPCWIYKANKGLNMRSVLFEGSIAWIGLQKSKQGCVQANVTLYPFFYHCIPLSA